MACLFGIVQMTLRGHNLFLYLYHIILEYNFDCHFFSSYPLDFWCSTLRSPRCVHNIANMLLFHSFYFVDLVLGTDLSLGILGRRFACNINMILLSAEYLCTVGCLMHLLFYFTTWLCVAFARWPRIFATSSQLNIQQYDEVWVEAPQSISE
jgi:hypothetical protein